MLAESARSCDNRHMTPAKLIAAKRDGHRLDDEEIAQLVAAYANGDVPDYQMAAMAMAIYFQGMDAAETVALTRAMLQSGKTLCWPGLDKSIVDKHSTGGIGDKVSIILAPALADCGMAVPMISGRGLGATGGTLDKLESISGFRTDLSITELQQVVDRVGCVITGASDEIAPADRSLYALRDVTATVPSIPLITASILSKKLAEGLDALVLDVKWGSGSFMKTLDRAKQLASSLVNTAQGLGVSARAVLTDMNQPLGKMVGNSVEVDECLDVLQGGGAADLVELTVDLGAQIVHLTQPSATLEQARSTIQQSISSGQALNKLEEMVSAQGGNLQAIRPRARQHVFQSTQNGTIQSMDSEQIGWAIIEMGGGRRKLGEAVDHSVGIEMQVRLGDEVRAGQPLMHVFCRNELWSPVQHLLAGTVTIGDDAVDVPPLIVEYVDAA